MALCPDHGPYTGTCKKCQEIDPRPTVIDMVKKPDVPEISDPDKYILRSFEVECLTAQIEIGNANQKYQQAQQSLNRFAATVFEKLELNPKDWILDTKAMKLVKREKENA